MHIQFHDNIYDPEFDLGSLTPGDRKRATEHLLADRFSTVGAILLHYVTLGIFSFVYYGMKHDDLPKLKSDDPNALMAVGLMFVPLFNLYWQFMLWVRLVRRLQFQYRLRGQSSPVQPDLAITCAVCNLIPGINLISFLILMPMLISRIQEAVDRLAGQNHYNAGYTN